jgi:hypothetical protein
MIAIDIDETICEYMYGMIVKYGPPAQWSEGLEVMFPGADLKIHFEPANHDLFLSSLLPVPDASRALWLLKYLGVPFCYMTARKPVHRQVTQTWLEINLFPNAQLILCEDKCETIRERKDITAMIDDQFKYLEVGAQEGLGLYVFDKPWNHDFLIGTRVLSWLHAIHQIRRDLNLYMWQV